MYRFIGGCGIGDTGAIPCSPKCVRYSLCTWSAPAALFFFRLLILFCKVSSVMGRLSIVSYFSLCICCSQIPGCAGVVLLPKISPHFSWNCCATISGSDVVVPSVCTIDGRSETLVAFLPVLRRSLKMYSGLALICCSVFLHCFSC